MELLSCSRLWLGAPPTTKRRVPSSRSYSPGFSFLPCPALAYFLLILSSPRRTYCWGWMSNPAVSRLTRDRDPGHTVQVQRLGVLLNELGRECPENRAKTAIGFNALARETPSGSQNRIFFNQGNAGRPTTTPHASVACVPVPLTARDHRPHAGLHSAGSPPAGRLRDVPAGMPRGLFGEPLRFYRLQSLVR